MKRNPFIAVAAAVKSLFATRPSAPARKTVTLEMPSDEKDAAPVLPQRPRSKHSRRDLPWRQANRPARRAALANTWSRVMAMVDHPLAAMAKRAPAGHSNPRKWARNRLRKLRAAVTS